MELRKESEIIKEAREKLGLTAGQIASKAKISLGQYKRFENGERNISTSTFAVALRVLQSLELDLSDFGKDNAFSDCRSRNNGEIRL